MTSTNQFHRTKNGEDGFNSNQAATKSEHKSSRNISNRSTEQPTATATTKMNERRNNNNGNKFTTMSRRL